MPRPVFRFAPLRLRLGRVIPLLLADTALLYLALVGVFKLREGVWRLLPPEAGTWALILAVYLGALGLGGLYRTAPRAFDLDACLRGAVALLAGWATSMALLYLLHPALLPPRSVTAAHVLFGLTGVLGLRAVLRYAAERTHPAGAPATPSHRVATAAPTPPADAFDALLERPPIEIDRGALHHYLAGRTVLVTGAGGSVGAELARQLVALRPFRLVLVDVSEYNLFRLEQTLRETPFAGDLQFRIADVRDEPIMRTLFSRFRPDVVLHAAAYKHVPLMERHPVEAFRNNTLATVALMRLCEAYQTEQFVFISTDKAVLPASVLGATKRLAEWYVRTVHTPMNCKIVRFGNVLGSQGSVVPQFAEQIAAGGPVTVTHPEMDRYFMTAREAGHLILQTLLFDTAPVFALQMGAPVRIVDLARRMIRLLRPDEPIDIVYTGIRPGEKLHEQLVAPEETPVPTPHPGILGLRGPAPFSRSELDAYFTYLQDLAAHHRPETLRKALFRERLRPIVDAEAPPPDEEVDYPSRP